MRGESTPSLESLRFRTAKTEVQCTVPCTVEDPGQPAEHSLTQGWRQEFSDGRADSSDEGTKIWLLWYYKCQKSPSESTLKLRP